MLEDHLRVGVAHFKRKRRSVVFMGQAVAGEAAVGEQPQRDFLKAT